MSTGPRARSAAWLVWVTVSCSPCATADVDPDLPEIRFMQTTMAVDSPRPGERVVGDYKPGTLVVGDWNSDGKADFAASRSFDDSVCIFLGSGTGEFRRQSSVAVAPRPIGIIRGDWDADGHTDLLVTSYNRSGVSVLLGDGAGGFHYSGIVPAGHSPQALVAGDWNADGALDLAVSSRNDHAIAVQLGAGRVASAAGSAPAPRVVAVGKFPSGITAGDWNGDRLPDLAVVNHYGHTVSILLGDGNGGFSVVRTVDVGLYPGDLDAADLNGDGALDLVVANVRGGTLSVLLGRGDGTFSELTRLKTGPAPAGVALADLDGDGATDVAVGSRDAPRLQIFRNELKAGKPFRLASTVPTDGNPVDVVAGDFNRDGRSDLLVFMPAANAFALLINRTDPTTAKGEERH